MVERSQVVTYLFLVPFICVFGIVGNILTLVVLMRGKFLGAAFTYLRGLAIFDMLGLVFILPICLVRCPPSVCQFEDEYPLKVYSAYIYICIGDIFLKASVLTTVLLTVERCLVIVFARTLNLSSNKSRFPLCALIGIFLFATLENLPTAWALTINQENRLRRTEYGKSFSYEVYLWFDAVLYQFLPIVILFTFNIILAAYLIKHRRMRQNLKRNLSSLSWENRVTSERRTLLMLVGIICMFLLTMLPCSVLQLIGSDLQYGSPTYVRFQMTVTALVSLNFACNFLLYCTLNKRFWFHSKLLLCRCCLCLGKNRVLPVDHIPSPLPWHTNNRQPAARQPDHANSLRRSSQDLVSGLEQTVYPLSPAERRTQTNGGRCEAKWAITKENSATLLESPLSARTFGSRVSPEDKELTDFVYQGPTSSKTTVNSDDGVYHGPTEKTSTRKCTESVGVDNYCSQGRTESQKLASTISGVYQGPEDATDDGAHGTDGRCQMSPPQTSAPPPCAAAVTDSHRFKETLSSIGSKTRTENFAGSLSCQSSSGHPDQQQHRMFGRNEKHAGLSEEKTKTSDPFPPETAFGFTLPHGNLQLHQKGVNKSAHSGRRKMSTVEPPQQTARAASSVMTPEPPPVVTSSASLSQPLEGPVLPDVCQASGLFAARFEWNSKLAANGPEDRPKLAAGRPKDGPTLTADRPKDGPNSEMTVDRADNRPNSEMTVDTPGRRPNSKLAADRPENGPNSILAADRPENGPNSKLTADRLDCGSDPGMTVDRRGNVADSLAPAGLPENMPEPNLTAGKATGTKLASKRPEDPSVQENRVSPVSSTDLNMPFQASVTRGEGSTLSQQQ